jgi:DNA-binding transcriptional LysR family regulator
LIAVERAGSFRVAASALGLVQSTLSQRIVHLEQMVGQPLISRRQGSNGTKLTPAGERLRRHAQAIFARLDAAMCDLAVVKEDRAHPRLRVGVFTVVSDRLLPSVVQLMAGTPAKPALELVERIGWAASFSRVADGTFDVALADLPLAPGPFAHRELPADRWVLVVRADSPLARAAQPPSLVELASLPLVLLRGPRLEPVLQQLRSTGTEPRFVFGSACPTAVQGFVAQGAGAALMPRTCVNERDKRIAVLALRDALPARRVAVYWHRDRLRTEGIDAFADALRLACGDEVPADDDARTAVRSSAWG